MTRLRDAHADFCAIQYADIRNALMVCLRSRDCPHDLHSCSSVRGEKTNVRQHIRAAAFVRQA